MTDDNEALFSDEEEQQRMTTLEKKRMQRDDNDLKGVMGSPSGRRFVWALLAQCGVFAGSYAEQPLGMAFNEGRRSIGLALMGRVLARTPDLFLTMQKENIDDGHFPADS